MNFKRLFLYVLIASVAVSALIGIAILLFGDLGERETKILLTTLTITATSVLGLACGASLEAGKGRVIPFSGIVFSVLSAVLWIVMLWSRFDPTDEIFAHTLMSATVLAFACAHVSLLSLARLDHRFAWSRVAVHVFVWSLAGLTIFILWADIDPSQNMLARIMGVLSIVIAALTVVTPVFHFLSAGERTADQIDVEIDKLRQRISELERQKQGLSQPAE